MKKIDFIIHKCSKERISIIIECFDNISYKFLNEDVKFEIFSDKLEQDIFFLNNLCKGISYTLEKVEKKNWIKNVPKLKTLEQIIKTYSCVLGPRGAQECKRLPTAIVPGVDTLAMHIVPHGNTRYSKYVAKRGG